MARIIARLDIKAPNLIKGIHLEGLRVMGDPSEFAQKYYLDGIDELLYMDAVASLYDRNSIIDLIKSATNNIFVPITVGGGIRSVSDVENALKAGADKVAINGAAVKNPSLINEIAQTFGSQCMVLSVEAKKVSQNRWDVYYHNGREKTELSVYDWCLEAVERGAGEILLTSIDQEGTGRGFDLDLIRLISKNIAVPVIASGGAGSASDVASVLNEAHADAVALANIFHYNKETVRSLKRHLNTAGVDVRL